MRQRKQMGNEQLDSKKSDREMLWGEEVRASEEGGVAEGGGPGAVHLLTTQL